jgi:hypothetical protein
MLHRPAVVDHAAVRFAAGGRHLRGPGGVPAPGTDDPGDLAPFDVAQLGQILAVQVDRRDAWQPVAGPRDAGHDRRVGRPGRGDLRLRGPGPGYEAQHGCGGDRREVPERPGPCRRGLGRGSPPAALAADGRFGALVRISDHDLLLSVPRDPPVPDRLSRPLPAREGPIYPYRAATASWVKLPITARPARSMLSILRELRQASRAKADGNPVPSDVANLTAPARPCGRGASRTRLPWRCARRHSGTPSSFRMASRSSLRG